jgi:hypothetical protein
MIYRDVKEAKTAAQRKVSRSRLKIIPMSSKRLTRNSHR